MGMPWSNSRPRARKYGRDHQAARDAHMAALRHAGSGTCAETRNPGSRCVMRSPVITPAMPLHLCHNSTTGEVLGLGHADCNVREAARRARRMQGRPQRQQQRARTDTTW